MRSRAPVPGLASGAQLEARSTEWTCRCQSGLLFYNSTVCATPTTPRLVAPEQCAGRKGTAPYTPAPCSLRRTRGHAKAMRSRAGSARTDCQPETATPGAEHVMMTQTGPRACPGRAPPARPGLPRRPGRLQSAKSPALPSLSRPAAAPRRPTRCRPCAAARPGSRRGRRTPCPAARPPRQDRPGWHTVRGRRLATRGGRTCSCSSCAA